jgi:hypothetical protein
MKRYDNQIDETMAWLRRTLEPIERAQRFADSASTEYLALDVDACMLRALGWYIGTGRSFVGLTKVLALLDASGRRTFLRRVRKGMLDAAREYERRHPVMGDMGNTILARALGFNDIREAAEWSCNLAWNKTARLPTKTARCDTQRPLNCSDSQQST